MALLATVGSYAVVKGEVSEKLALRLGAGMKASAPPKIVRSDSRDGLDDPRFHFDAKEESNEGLSSAPLLATATLLYRWAGLLGYILVPLAVYGAVFGRAGPGKILVAVYLIVFTVIVVRHSTTLGYLSGRHTLTLVTLTLPWTAAGYITATRHLALWRGWDPVGVPRRRAFCALLALVIGTSIQIYKPGHPSRWGHLAAGRWLARNTTPSDRVLDTRGWARFVADRPGYDYWHVKQALNDPNLAYVVVGRDEFEADSPRGATLRAILAYAGQAEVDFPSRRGGHDKSVRIFRYQSPETWEGLSL